MLLYYSIYVRAMLVQYILIYISSILRNEILEEEINCIGFIIVFLSFSFWFHAYCSVGHAIVVLLI
jgi:hypothetical protein